VLDRAYQKRMMNPAMATLDTSRGCPFTCSYCSVKNVMGRTMRSREPRAVLDWLRRAWDEHGIRYVFLVDDNFYRNPRWEEILDGLIELRRGGRDLGFMMQVDVEASGGLAKDGGEREATAARFLDKSARAGCYQVFVGFESFSAANLTLASKHQNVRLNRATDEEQARAEIVERYRRVVDNWHRVGVGVHGAGMIGFPWDGPDAGLRMARDFVDIRLDQASFFIVTPLPGTEDWDAAVAERRVKDFDFDHYTTTQPVTHHPRMTYRELLASYDQAMRTFYSSRRLATYLLTRGWNRQLGREARDNNVRQFLWYWFSHQRRRHPMIGGFWRRPGARLKERMAAVVAAPAAAGGHLRALVTEACSADTAAGAAAAVRSGLGGTAEHLTEVLAHLFARLGRLPVAEDAAGVRPLSYLAPHVEMLVGELRALKARGDLGAALELVEERLQQKWLELRQLGAHEARLFEELIEAWREAVSELGWPGERDFA
jgi:hypothetical protein